MWVKTLCPLSSSTRNMAFGRGSTTVPSTSMASFFAKLPGFLSNTQKYAGSVPTQVPVYGAIRGAVYPRARPGSAEDVRWRRNAPPRACQSRGGGRGLVEGYAGVLAGKER